MLNLLLPGGERRSTDFPASTTIDDLAAARADLGTVEFHPSHERAAAIELRLALRYGLAHPEGVVVDYLALADFRQILAVLRDNPQNGFTDDAVESIPATDVMQYLVPGWHDGGITVAEPVVDSTIAQLQELWRGVEAALQETPASEDLIHHWVALGGVLPEPV